MATPGIPGEISADGLYTLPEIKRRLGLGTHAIRMARKQGLTVKVIGRKAFVRGSALIEYFDDNAKKV